MTFANFLI